MSAWTTARHIGALTLAMLLSACATTGPASSTAVDPSTEFALEVTDRPALRRFEVRLVSTSQRPLCVPIEAWPDINGRFTEEMLDVHVQIPGERVDIAPAFRSVYCPGGCGHRTVAPGATLDAFIAYEAFADADKVASSAERVLHYPLLVHACK